MTVKQFWRKNTKGGTLIPMSAGICGFFFFFGTGLYLLKKTHVSVLNMDFSISSAAE